MLSTTYRTFPEKGLGVVTVTIVDAPPTTLAGYTFLASCEKCGGALIAEGSSRGREDIVGACRNVSAVAYCADCGYQVRIDVVITPINQRRTPESRWVRT